MMRLKNEGGEGRDEQTQAAFCWVESQVRLHGATKNKQIEFQLQTLSALISDYKTTDALLTRLYLGRFRRYSN